MNNQDALSLTYKTGISNLKLEGVISQDGHYSYFYAKYVLRGRFELGELVISKYEFYPFCYAINVLKGRFRLGEESMNKNAYCEYLVKVMGYTHE